MTLQRGQNSKLGTDVRSENYRTRRQAGSTLQFRDRQTYSYANPKSVQWSQGILLPGTQVH